MPDRADILLQRAPGTMRQGREKAPGERNTAGDIDIEAFALHRYLELLMEGQTVALDMLFAPSWAMIEEPSAGWKMIFQSRDRLLNRQCGGFIGYAQKQAARYGIKGSRIHAVRSVVAWCDAMIVQHGGCARIGEVADSLTTFLADSSLEHVGLVAAEPALTFLECCNRKMPFTASLIQARSVYARVLDEYGQRALQAEKNEGLDWKALSHAVRIGWEAVELLTTGHITFPLPNAAHILSIKRGERPYKAVAEEIESLLVQAEAASATSALPEVSDRALAEDIVMEVYGAATDHCPNRACDPIGANASSRGARKGR